MRILVRGAGIIGLTCAEELVRGGHDVTVVDPAPASGATYAAAGMLAPAGEAWFGEEALLALGIESANLWPGFAARIEEASGRSVDYRPTGTVVAGLDRDDLVDVERTAGMLTDAGRKVELLDRHGVRQREPRLSARVSGGMWVPEDHQVNPRRVASALLAILGDRVVATADDSSFDLVIKAAGVGTLPKIRPVRGELLRAQMADPPEQVVRARVHGEPVYVVPRQGGEIVIGATEEEHPANPNPLPRLGRISRLLENARTLIPELDEAEIIEVIARDRPGSPDNKPIIERLDARTIVATGHYRGGVLLAPVTALRVRALVEES